MFTVTVLGVIVMLSLVALFTGDKELWGGIVMLAIMPVYVFLWMLNRLASTVLVSFVLAGFYFAIPQYFYEVALGTGTAVIVMSMAHYLSRGVPAFLSKFNKDHA